MDIISELLKANVKKSKSLFNIGADLKSYD
jgi:hypothetical protein